MEKTNKIMAIIMSCVSFVLITLFLVGFLALPLVSGGNLYDIIKQFIDIVKSISGESGSVSTLIYYILTFGGLFGLALGFGVACLVKSIILLVNAIKGLSSSKAPVKPFVGLGVTLLVFAAFLSAFVEFTLGAGGIMFLVAGIVALTCAGVNHIMNYPERKLVNKILDMSTVLLAMLGIIFVLADGVLTMFIGGMSAVAGRYGEMIKVILMMFGAILIIVGFGFASKVVESSYRFEVVGKEVDYVKATIVKAALWFGFTLVGFILLVISGSGGETPVKLILGMVFSALALGGAIANKVLEGKKAE